jgi:hypothetical protein
LTNSTGSLGFLHEDPRVLDRRERLAGSLGKRLVAVMPVERGTVVDQPRAPVPDEEVGVARSAIDVRHQRIEPDHIRGELGVQRRRPAGRVLERAGQEVEPEVDARAGGDQLIDLGIGLRPAELGIDLDQHRFGDR